MSDPAQLTAPSGTDGPGPEWVDELLLTGPAGEPVLHLGDPVDRDGLRSAVRVAQERLTAAGLRPGGGLALRLPPSVALVAHLLAGWRTGAQVVLLDHRLTDYEVARAVDRMAPQVLASAEASEGRLRGFSDVVARIETRAGRPAETGHALVQLSSGSTGPSKVIGRTAADLTTEIGRYVATAGMPVRGERLVMLSSPVHTYGLVGGILYGLHAGVEIVVPERLTADAILATVADRPVPTAIMGVPFHVALLGAVADPPSLPNLVRAMSAGERMRPGVADAFTDRYGVPLGQIYGMTEVGLIAADLSGAHRPGVGRAVPGVEVRVDAGELVVSCPDPPYLGPTDPTRWQAGWLRTRDAGTVDPDSGVVTVLGRLDSQVAIGGMKVDLTEVEHVLGEVAGVREAVVVFDGAIEAYVALSEGTPVDQVTRVLAERLAPVKRPRRLHVLPQLPRTTTGKLLRDIEALRAARPAVGS
jgi:acyl-coenzyme A synthetase/AMP-(fatty) acid ligase